MNFELITTPQFVKSVKKLSKKYKQIKGYLQNISKEIENENFVDLGYETVIPSSDLLLAYSY